MLSVCSLAISCTVGGVCCSIKLAVSFGVDCYLLLLAKPGTFPSSRVLLFGFSTEIYFWHGINASSGGEYSITDALFLSIILGAGVWNSTGLTQDLLLVIVC